MPHVASDTKTFAPKALPPYAAARPLPASDRTQALPFESLLDDSTPAPAPPPARSSANDEAPRADRPAPPARAATNDAAKNGNTRKADDPATSDGKTAKSGKTDKTDKADKTKTGKTGDDGKAVTGDKAVDAAEPADGLIPAAAVAALPAAADPAQAPPVIDAIAVALAPAAEAQAASPAENPAGVVAAALPETGAVLQAGAAKLADGESLEDKLTAKSSTKFAGKNETKNNAKIAATSDAPAQAEVKPQGDADKSGDAAKPLDADKAAENAVAHARGEVAAKDNRAATSETPDKAADGNATAPKFNADLAPPSPLTAPAGSLQPANAPLAAPMTPAATAIPLAGVAIEIAGKALAGKNHFEIRLDPPELGRIEVRLEVDRDGNVTSRMIADRQDTLDLLRRDAAGLERALQDAGLKTGDNGLQFSLRDHTAGRQQADGGADTARLVAQDETLGAADILPSGYSRLAGQGSGIDIHV